MLHFLALVAVIVAVLAGVGILADRRAASGDTTVTPGLALLPGDIKYESQDGRLKLYFPIVTSTVLAIALSLLIRWLR